ncbi:hypothetical protein [Caldimonas brevitalea]|uniref:Uncharacterized protein n=1 Tax=Caldimonas brevitalea TaxID=413882 RepID=A0A0G3BQ42_9BURK|nr:hypothetical protein [Caldimonas brevitalea]AKJ31544.1 hypothetical protein AAW51_4853 [Caldimonas brevitalea]
MIEKLLAWGVLAVCVVLLVRLMLGAARRARFDAAVRSGADAGRRWLRSLRRPGERRRSRAEAERIAEEAIRRARGEWDGNVYRPKSFKRPRKPH